MKKIIFVLIVFLLGVNNVLAFETNARCSILMDMDTNHVLHQKNAHEVRSVASISKIMTAILAIESNKLDDYVLIGEEINKAYGSGIYIKVGEKMQLRDLVYGLMLRSGNDAALAIANYVGGDVDSFVQMMNDKAKEIGMKNTKFNNPHGLDENGGNKSTAYDMALLTSYAMKNPLYEQITGTKKHTVKTDVNYYSWDNKNKLLFGYKYTTGGKTGFTEVARRTLVTTASKDNINLVAVTLNDGDDFNDHELLFEEAFNNYTKYRLLSKGNVNIIGEKYYINENLYVNENFDVLLPNDQKPNALLHYQLNKLNSYNDGDEVGTVKLLIDNEKILEQKVYVKKEIVKKSWWVRFKEWLRG